MERRRHEIKLCRKKISEYRRQLNISQATLAEQVGVSSKYISAVETGHEIPALDTIIAIADILQQTPNSIFGDLMAESYDYEIINELSEVSRLSPKSQEKIFAVLEALISTSDSD